MKRMGSYSEAESRKMKARRRPRSEVRSHQAAPRSADCGFRQIRFERSCQGPQVKRSILTTAVWSLLCSAAIAAEPGATIGTDDGLALRFSKDGRVAAVRLDQREVPLSATPVLFQVRDAAAKSAFVPVGLAVQRRGRAAG